MDYKNMSPVRRRLALVLIAASLALVGAAQRDIQRRSEAEVRGSRILWRLVCLNALGAAGYFGWGAPKDIDTFPIGTPEMREWSPSSLEGYPGAPLVLRGVLSMRAYLAPSGRGAVSPSRKHSYWSRVPDRSGALLPVRVIPARS
jgi:hypothetical protein